MPFSLTRKIRRYLRRESGASTVEFVVIFPFLVFLIIFILWASSLIGAASDVQALAHQLSRRSLTYFQTPATLCNQLRTVELEEARKHVASRIPANRLVVTCTVTKDKPYMGLSQVDVEVTYNFAGQTLADLGRNFGVSFTSIKRKAAMLF